MNIAINNKRSPW